MVFNTEKCHVLHIRRTNGGHDFTLNSTVLSKVQSERDIGVLVSNNLKPGDQCRKAANTARKVLAQILRTFSYRDRTVLPCLYKLYVRPHMEFAVQAWRPWQRGDIDPLENVQRKMVSAISGLEGRTYEDRLAEVNMVTVEDRYQQLDMIQAYKILRGIDSVDKTHWFQQRAEVANQRTRAATGGPGITGQRSRLELRRNFFSKRVVDPWNRLSVETKLAKTVREFKSRLKHEDN